MIASMLINESDVLFVLESLLGLDFQIRGDEAWMSCIEPNHEDVHPSFSINIESGLAHCFACGWRGDIVQVAATVWNVPRHQAQLMLYGSPNKDSLLRLINNRLARTVIKRRRVITPRYWPCENECKDYLLSRGFTDSAVADWDVGYIKLGKLKRDDGSAFYLSHCLVLPVRNNGRTVGWIYRSTHRSPRYQPRYFYSPGLPVGSIWYGWDRAASEEEVVVVEGPLDTMRLWQCGIPAVGCLGSHPGIPKINKLKRFRSVIVLGDRDPSGLMLTSKIVRAIGETVPLRVARYPPESSAKDPCELTPYELRRVIQEAEPALTWLQRKENLR